MQRICLITFLIFTYIACTHNTIHEDLVKLEKKEYLEDLFGSLSAPLNLNSGKKKLTIYKFVAPWCQSCWEDLPSLKRLEEKLGKNRLKVILLAIENNSEMNMGPFNTHFHPGLFELTKETSLPQIYIFQNKTLFFRASLPFDFSTLQFNDSQ